MALHLRQMMVGYLRVKHMMTTKNMMLFNEVRNQC